MTPEINDDHDLPMPPIHSQEFLDAPIGFYREMRNRRPMLRFADGAIASTTNRASFEEVMRSPSFAALADPTMLGLERPMIPLHVDRPDHVKYRRLLDPIFAPKRIASLADEIEATVDRLIDGFIGSGSCAFVDDFATPLPATLFLRMFGAPIDDLKFLVTQNERWVSPAGDTTESQTVERRDAAQEMYRYLQSQIDEHRAHPTNNIISQLISSEVDGRALSDDELLDVLINLLIGGLDTVKNTLSCNFARLAQHPAERQHILDDPAVIPTVIEEYFRYESPVLYVIRVAVEDTVVQGCEVAAGTVVFGYLGAANHDDDEFERPDQVDFSRDSIRHFAFGAGMHRCLGSHLARLELRVATRRWHERIPQYGIDPSCEIHYTDGIRSVPDLRLVFPRGGQ